MSEFSYPFTGGAGGQDGPYSASFYAEMTEALFNQQEVLNASYLIKTGNGVDNPLEVTQTSPASNSIEVKEGKALINGYYYFNDSDLTLTIQPNTDGSGFDRVDTVVLEIDFVNQEVRAIVVEGTAASSPVAPTLTKNASVYQVPIANVDVANLFTTILDADIDNSVKIPAILMDVEYGGTGVQSVVEGDMYAATGVNAIDVISPLAIDGAVLVRDDANTPKFTWIDKRITIVYKTSATNGAALASPITIDGEEDLAGNLRAIVSSNRFYPEAGTYKIWLWTNINNFTTSQNQFLYLYDTTAAANIQDIDGNDVRTTNYQFALGSQENFQFFNNWITFDGTETIELRANVTTNYRYDLGASGSPVNTKPIVIFIERMF